MHDGGHYYNELDPFAAKWLRKLFPAAEVDSRSIVYVEAEDVIRATQAHFFGGIGGWSLALRIAGWPEDKAVWTGSCPCQPFSVAGAGGGESDDRHLWPEFRRLIGDCRPPVVFGEQVASPAGRQWFSRVRIDLERMGYRVGAADLCAAGAGSPNLRQRLNFVADTRRPECGRRIESPGEQRRTLHASDRSEIDRVANSSSNGSIGRSGISSNEESQGGGRIGSTVDGSSSGIGNSNGPGCSQYGGSGSVRAQHVPTERASCLNRVGDAERYGLRISRGATSEQSDQSGYWSVFDIIECRDGKARRIPPVESRILPVVDGVPNRVGRLRGYGNSINPWITAVFIRAYMDTLSH